MTGDICPAALRLLATLPVRTHEQARPASKLTKPGSGRGGANSRAIFIAGVRYASLEAASKAHRLGYKSIYRLIDLGRARYAKDNE